MTREKEQLTKEAALLNKFLGQYKYCLNAKKNLETRKKEIEYEYKHPLSSPQMDGISAKSSGKQPEGFTSILIMVEEINKRIDEQMNKCINVLTQIYEIISFLPDNTIEKLIFEHKYIDCMNWDKICRIENITKTPAVHHWRKGLYRLLEFKKIKKMIEEYSQIIEKITEDMEE